MDKTAHKRHLFHCNWQTISKFNGHGVDCVAIATKMVSTAQLSTVELGGRTLPFQ